MASEARFEVTQPYHGPDGKLIYDVGTLLPADSDHGDIRGRLVVVQVPDKPSARRSAKHAAPEPEPVPEVPVESP